MRLGFDLDGTVADLQAALAREARRLFPDVDPATLPRSVAADTPASGDESATSETPLSIGTLSPRQQRELWEAVCSRENFWETLQEIERGALARLFALARERRWEIIFLTSRPETAGDTAQNQSYRWLVGCGYLTPSIFVVHGSRGKIAAALQLDVVVDDRPENCLDVGIDSKARAILVWRGDEGKVPGSARQLGIGSVKSIGECLDLLEQIDSPELPAAGMMDRLKRLLGLKPQSARVKPAHQSSSTTIAADTQAGVR
jgi:hypothetical protein